ncbi:DUF3558 domain-containing protein [Rhodococcus sp. GXMU-t2271]|uniref:DUF3558 domain-containing protein n=2 Tax=Rhodococcus TaxID=1827 RepID=A0ABT7RQZ2_9NOCA|nr:DUF3558 domain-containing protein [Rhodococcus indonesiensis]MDM7489689.1 DUF3558 domain-containing protein [Rhodococcus indonesiensis]
MLNGCASPASTAVATNDSLDPPTTTTTVPRLVDESDRPHVAFDPCLDIPDHVLKAAGYDPTSEDNADFAATHFTMLGCSYKGNVTMPGVAAYRLTVLSANFDWSTELRKVADNDDDITHIEIAGQRAILKTNPSLPESCGVSVEAFYGVLIFSSVVFGKGGTRVPEEQWCTGLVDTAERIVAVLDDFESRTR